MNIVDMGALTIAGGVIMWQLGAVGTDANVSDQDTALAAGRIIVVSDQVLPSTGVAARDFAQFSSEPNHFGAFAMTKDGKPGYSFRANTLEAAKSAAAAYCGQKHSAPCRVYAVMVPEVPQTDLPESMGADVAAAFRDYAQTSGYGAFAVADNGAYGMTWEWDSTKGARRQAMSICASYAADEDTPDQSRTVCRVVASR